MKTKFLVYCVLFALTVSAIVGFSTNDNPLVKTQTQRNIGNNPLEVYGPALDNPLSTLNESFEGTTFPPAGWARFSPLGNEGFTRQTAGTTPLPGWTGTAAITVPPNGGTACAYVTYGLVGANNNEWLITPQITNVQPGDSLKFWLKYYVPTYSDSFLVKISTTTQTVAAMTIPVYAKRFFGAADTGYFEVKSNIGALVPAGSNIYIGFNERITDNITNGSAFSMDLVSVTAGAPPPPTCAYTWAPQTSGTTGQLLTVSAVDAQIGWAGGGPTSGAGPAVVVKTTNGGATWTNAAGTGITGSVFNIYAWSANDAIVTTSPSATFIYKTSNGGTTWTQVYTLAGGFIDALQMVSATEGYGLGDPVGGKWTVVKTTDGGNTWARMATEPTAGAEAGWNNSFHIVGTNMWFGTNNTKVYHSTDLGLTWTSGATTGTLNTYAVHYNSATTGTASGDAMVLSTNGGTNYSTITSPGTVGSINSLEGAGTDWWATRTDANVYRSTNGGTSWTTAYTQTGATFADMDFAIVGGCPVGWAVGSGGNIAKMATTTGIANYNSEIPSSFNLKQNYPNPFNPTTNINFSIPKSGFVTLKVYDMVGQEVAVLVNEVKSAGNYIVGFNASNLPSGAYFYRLESNNVIDTKKMLLVK